jgi:hypothetical protein
VELSNPECAEQSQLPKIEEAIDCTPRALAVVNRPSLLRVVEAEFLCFPPCRSHRSPEVSRSSRQRDCEDLLQQEIEVQPISARELDLSAVQCNCKRVCAHFASIMSFLWGR